MSPEEFEKVFEYVTGRSRDTLVVKAREYASDVDRLHNCKKVAAFEGCTAEQVAWKFNMKHLTSISDMVAAADRLFPSAVWDEKIGDAINYLILLRAIVGETNAGVTTTDPN